MLIGTRAVEFPVVALCALACACGGNVVGAGGDGGGGGGGGDAAADASGNGNGDGNGGGGIDAGLRCGVIPAIIRDFQKAHPDFESFGGTAAFPGIVQTELGADNKPVYAHPANTPHTTGPDEFAQWYNDVPGVNMPFEIQIELEEVSPGVFTFSDSDFFPIDDRGFGNEDNDHNFHFTTEIHTQFEYRGGEDFTFTGDDDLWMFINGRLAIDLGGPHPPLTRTVNLDAQAAALGIEPGTTYAMDIFHAERHTDESNFRIDTTINCFIIIN